MLSWGRSDGAKTNKGDEHMPPTAANVVAKRHYAVKVKRKSKFIRLVRRCGEGGARVLRSTPDWGDGAVVGDHLWSPTSASGDSCYLGDAECPQRHGGRLKCAACRIVAHQACLEALLQRAQSSCKPTFCVGVRHYRTHADVKHHWVHRRSEKGKCKACGKALPGKLFFSSKEIVAITCSWCKDSYHNKDTCFNEKMIGEKCSMGELSNIIVPPSWIVKLPKKGSFESSLRKTPNKKVHRRVREPRNENTFSIKYIPTATVKPVIVFINPKSGGNQGVKLLQQFQWLLNPRQVFDLTQGGPGPGLEMFRHVRDLRVLACGGDGTVGWVLSVLDRINMRPPVGVLPLGTGNDLSRALDWGGGYEDEPISKILTNIDQSDMVKLDRWQLDVKPNPDTKSQNPANSRPELPLNVFNNYFSIGVDAHIALAFHEAREAHPERFSSRFRNKMFYGSAGGIDLVKQKWKALSEFVTLECDGRDYTPLIKELRVHAIVFLNIKCYGGGTTPWDKSAGSVLPATDDGLIEVLGLTTYQLPLLQAGGHGSCICQCKTAKIVTNKAIPMQVDGEACRLNPSLLAISQLNQAFLLAKKKPGRPNLHHATVEKTSLILGLLNMSDYECYHYEKEKLASTAEQVGTLEVSPATDLDQLRKQIQTLLQVSHAHVVSWWFVDSITAERFFRVDQTIENVHYPADIAEKTLYILENSLETPDVDSEAVPHSAAGSLDRTEPSLSANRTEPSLSVDRTGPCLSVDSTGPSLSVDSTGPSLSADRTGLSVDNSTAASASLDISQSFDTPSAAISIDVTESHTSESGPSSPMKLKEQGIAVAPTPKASPRPSTKASHAATPKGSPAVTPTRSPASTPKASPTAALAAQDSSSLCLIPQANELQSSHDSIAIFKRNLLEKTSDTLLKAAKVGDLRLIKELYGAGYSLLSIDAGGQTALHVAARYGHVEVVKYLVTAAPSSIVHMQDNEKGQTALHKAAMNKRRVICCMLVAGGANPQLADHAGLTPRQLALRADDRELAGYLESQEHFQLVAEDLETAV